MTDLRERLERIGAGRGRVLAAAREKGYAERVPLPTPFTTSEERVALADLGLAVVGRDAPDPLVLAHLGLRGEPPARWSEIVFLDAETTGLAGGTGTYVFLLGTAWMEEGELVLRQHVLHDLGAERVFIAALRAELERFRACASYNGKCFDLPLLRARFVLALRAELSVDASHLDLLHPARRLWRGRFGSTTLRQLEESVLDDARADDIPGALIPERYFAYLSRRDPSLLGPILAHNLRDLTSLVRITDRVASAVIAARAGRAPDHAPA
ncbi:MAG: ribonuclease H-like domain-containing protein, partial [Candidatus Limnocylindria bacterium]